MIVGTLIYKNIIPEPINFKSVPIEFVKDTSSGNNHVVYGCDIDVLDYVGIHLNHTFKWGSALHEIKDDPLLKDAIGLEYRSTVIQ